MDYVAVIKEQLRRSGSGMVVVASRVIINKILRKKFNLSLFLFGKRNNIFLLLVPNCLIKELWINGGVRLLFRARNIN